MIISNEPISMAEAKEYLDKENENEAKLKNFINKFAKLEPVDAKDLRKKLQKLDLMKMKEQQISKIIDILPSDKEELNKGFTDISLDEDETKKILDTVKEFK